MVATATTPYAQSPPRPPHAVQVALRLRRRDPLARAGHRRQLGHLIALRRDAHAATPRGRAGAAGQPWRAWPEPGLADVRPGGGVWGRVLLFGAARCSE